MEWHQFGAKNLKHSVAVATAVCIACFSCAGPSPFPPEKTVAAYEHVKSAADRGDITAIREMYDAYFAGDPLPKNEATAERYLQKAVAANAQWAVLLVARRNERSDPQGSMGVYLKLARAGNCFAQAKVSVSYFFGDIIAKNTTQSYFWKLVALSGGNRTSEYHKRTNLFPDMSVMIFDGVNASCWDVAFLFDLSSSPIIPNLENVLPAASRQIAQTAATNWRPGQQEPLLPPPAGMQPQVAQSVGWPKAATEATLGMLPPPRIEVPPQISTDEDAAVLAGRVTSSGGAATLSVDGAPIPIRADGGFSVSKAVTIGVNTFHLIAMDAQGGTSQQTVTIVRTAVPAVPIAYAALDPGRAKAKPNAKALALIIGIEKYERAPTSDFADNDARSFYDYAANALGVPRDRIKLLVGADARRLDIQRAIRIWLSPLIARGQSDVFVYFSGHGLASVDGKDLFLLPYDGDGNMLEESAIRRKDLIDTIVGAGAASATFFLDTCYSGGTKGNDTLIESARPVVIVAKEQPVPPNVTIFAAAANDQLSSTLPPTKHGLFSYYLMKGLEGNAAGTEHTITAAKLEAYLADHVSPEAAKLGRAQMPQLIGDGNRVISSW